jgi:cytochrome c oxidase assembly factor CtaG
MMSRFALPIGIHMRRLLAGMLMLGVLPAVAQAHPGSAPQPHDLWHAWSLEPAVLLGLGAGVWCYLRGVRALWRRAGRGRGVARWRVACYLGGLACVAMALVSPIDRVAEALFSVHMIQHLLLIMAAPPLLTLGEPVLVCLWALPAGARRRVGRAWRRARALRRLWHVVTIPLVAWLLHVVAVWAWHLPGPYDRALRDPATHVAEHLSFLATALVFWWLLTDRRARRRLGVGGAILYLFTAALSETLLGAALSLSRRPWYAAHWGTTTPWGLTPLEDQQLAGLLMWVPAGLVYLVALAPLIVRALSGGQRPPTSRTTARATHATVGPPLPAYPPAESRTG